MISEVWKPVPGYEGLYEASSLGRIRSLGNGRNVKGRILVQVFGNTEYLRVCLYKNKTKSMKSVHRLVYSAFYGPIPPGMEVNHINEDKTDNRLENLNLMTRTENNNWGSRNTKSAAAQSKPVIQYSLTGDYIATYDSPKTAASIIGVDCSAIRACARGAKHYNTAGGYKWRYV